MLGRYLVLGYPLPVDLEQVKTALSHNPHILYVGENRRFEPSATPNDPLFAVTANPLTHQWGSHALDLPQAWDWAKGHAYIGIVDTGIDADHEDLRGYYRVGGLSRWDGGNYRPHLAWDYGYDDPDPDERTTPSNVVDAQRGGHGTHVAGIVGATPNNGLGVAGVCWRCSLIVMKVSKVTSLPDGGSERFWFNAAISESDLVAGINGAMDRGAQVINLSLGFRPDQDEYQNCAISPMAPICNALALASARDTTVAAAAGNDSTTIIDFPASDPRVLGAGGLAPGSVFWDDCASGGNECGSNRGPDLLVTPAKQVLSTFYRGMAYLEVISQCSDVHLAPDGDGLGPCTGTSMSAPYLSAAVGILRSIDPLLATSQVRSLLETNLRVPFAWDFENGRGIVDVDAAVLDALGPVAGTTAAGRLTPLFSLYGAQAEDHTYTTFPQAATAWMTGPGGYDSVGPAVPGYGAFPGVTGTPRASAYLFSTDRSPDGRALVPLYRLSYAGTTATNPANRDHVYTTEVAGILAFGDVGYEVDGIEGYLYPRCTPEPSCIPAGAERLYRRYHARRDDWAIFPENELAGMVAAGYTQSFGNDWIGYVYPNRDSDGDTVIDGYETLLGLDPGLADTDCDGSSDGLEVLGYPRTDPLDGSCGGGPCSKCELYSGSLSGAGDFDWQPGGNSYFSGITGLHQGWLEGPVSANFDLELHRWLNSQWVLVASTKEAGSSESLAFFGGSGFYVWTVVSRSGAGAYDFWLQRP